MAYQSYKEEQKDYKQGMGIFFWIFVSFFISNAFLVTGNFWSFIFPVAIFGFFWTIGFKRAQRRRMNKQGRLPQGDERRYFRGRSNYRKAKSYEKLYDERDLI